MHSEASGRSSSPLNWSIVILKVCDRFHLRRTVSCRFRVTLTACLIKLFFPDLKPESARVLKAASLVLADGAFAFSRMLPWTFSAARCCVAAS
jgi:hypothetical protein